MNSSWNPFAYIRRWWQKTTGEEETPVDGDTPAWVTSLMVHVVLLVVLFCLTILPATSPINLTLTAPLEEELKEEPIVELPKQFEYSDVPQEKIGANSVNGEESALAQAQVLSDVSEIPTPPDLVESEVGEVLQVNDIQVATGPVLSKTNLYVRGSAQGVGTTGAPGAIDRITHEILRSLEERKTLVVWLFDQSGSMLKQRKEIRDRFDRIYEELGIIEAAGNEAFKKHADDKPLLTSVVAFGQNVELKTKEPTDNLQEIKSQVDSIATDTTGIERVFSAIYMAVDRYKSYRVPDGETGQPKRNVMIVVVSDEIGDDQEGLDETVKMCRRYEVPVYVIGVPAPFGQKELMVKWVDPDPKFDQTPGWGRVDMGPESFMPERIKLRFTGVRGEEDPIDSGFGPYALTRLCWETGGIYFAVHPNRNVQRAVTREETAAYSAYVKYFFDPEVMRRYRPEYVSVEEYKRRVSSNLCRLALIEAARLGAISPMDHPQMTFVRADEAAFVNAVSEAQKAAAKLEPQINAIYEILKRGEADRARETTPRWQAGYDLAMGRVSAVKVRTEAYNAMLADAKTRLKFQDPKNNTWELKPADKVTTGSQAEKLARQAKELLQRVVAEHPGTPWAMLAERELKEPIGWEWTEKFTDTTPRREGAGNGGNPAPANDALRMLQKGPEKRPVPKL